MIRPRLEWLLPEPLFDPPAFAGFGPPVATLLARRGFRTQPELDTFLGAGAQSLHPVELMADAGVALDRLETAVDRGERIAIWGDYDADGMSAVAVWAVALRALGAEAVRHVPSRLAEGYGMSTSGLERLSGLGVTLVVTCDCGVGNVAEVEHARGLGIEVIVTDHHLPGGELPRAVAVVDPHRPDCEYPDPDLTGAGIAYKLASALVKRRGAQVSDLAALAAIGTVADMAPMTGESRAIVRLGLAEMAATQRAGLRALLARACERPERPTARDLAFTLAPRVNAAGRIDEAELAISLLLEEDPEAAERGAQALEDVHLRRREMTVSAVNSARAMVEGLEGTGPIVVREDSWAPGIIGLVAGRLAEDLSRPVAAAVLVGAEVRGSVRAPDDFHAAHGLEACAHLLTKRGGHAGAGGFSLLPEMWDAFVTAFGALARPYPPGAETVLRVAGRMEVDLVLPARHLGWRLADELDRLAPYGPGHREPLLAITGLRVGSVRRVGADGGHLAFRMLRGAETMDAIAFSMPADRPVPEEGALVDLLGTLERDTFQGQARLRIRVVDYASADASPLAARRRAAQPTT
ncbi:MAG TPA: single-stranded-DNA-specific exonuclease RecJ, partial [Candidatus Limnocylindria bacterium]|nr:single-stranded-DNA-specific exonuclease RecJ [Candidatus Limnocylindria bacterium]